jgi:hypothetical protein
MEFAAAIDELIAGVAPARRATSLGTGDNLPTTVDLPTPEPAPHRARRLSAWFWVALLLLGALAAAYLSRDDDEPAPARAAAPPAPAESKVPATVPTPIPTPFLVPTPASVPAVDAQTEVAIPAVIPDAGVAVVPDAAVAVVAPPPAPDGGLLLGAIDLDDAGLPIVDDTEPDPETADNPDPAAIAEPAADEDEAPDAPTVIVDEKPDPKVPPPPTLAKTTKGAVRLIKQGQRELALKSLRLMWPKKKKSAYIPFLLGNLYTDKHWWSVAMDHYRIAIRKNKAYKRNGTLNRNVIRMLASKKTMKKASLFLRKTIGRPAKPYVQSCARHNKSITMRKRCAAVARMIR